MEELLFFFVQFFPYINVCLLFCAMLCISEQTFYFSSYILFRYIIRFDYVYTTLFALYALKKFWTILRHTKNRNIHRQVDPLTGRLVGRSIQKHSHNFKLCLYCCLSFDPFWSIYCGQILIERHFFPLISTFFYHEIFVFFLQSKLRLECIFNVSSHKIHKLNLLPLMYTKPTLQTVCVHISQSKRAKEREGERKKLVGGVRFCTNFKFSRQ